MIFNQDKAIEIVQFVVNEALQAGADEAAAQIECQNLLFTRFAKNHIIQNMDQNPVTVTLAVSVGKKECSLSISGCEIEAIKRLAKNCVENSRFFFDNDEHLPPVSIGKLRKVTAVDQSILDLTPIELAENVGNICQQAKKQNVKVFGTYRKFHGLRAIYNSSNTSATHEWSKLGCSITVKTGDDRGSGREENSVFFMKDLNPNLMYQKAYDTALRSRNPIEIEAGDYTVILSPQAAASYLSAILYCLDARMIEEGRSVFSRSTNGNGTPLINSQIFSPMLSIRSLVDDPQYPVAPFNPAFSFDHQGGQSHTSRLFSHGLPTENKVYVDNGRVQDLFYSYYWANHKNITPIGHPSLIVFQSKQKEKTIEQMIEETERGIYISSLWYIRLVDPNNLLLTGLTRDGTFLIKNGNISKPIKNFRFNESPFISLKNIQSMAKPELRQIWMQNMLMPAVKIDNFTFSSISEAI